MTNGRLDAVEIACRKEPLVVEPPSKATSDYFGCKVFNRSAMRKYLSSDTRRMVYESIEQGVTLDKSVAEYVAAGMKQWAMEMGATHYTHWFQPLTGGTAEKHDSFINPCGDGQVLMEFSGKELIKGEPDASSFPSGGLRATFEARGYTAWDCTSPAFVREDAAGATLCIPTAFCSYTGEALDQKTPLLRSMDAINIQALRILKLFGNTTSKKVTPSVGAEQEYFIVDREKYLQRKDLIFTGRTLFGAMPPKGQELDDHYFGAIPERISSFMKDVNEELWKMGVSSKTQHNEVAPAQHELAPIYAQCNTATDNNQLIMEVLKKTAYRHGLVCLLHEKPFAGVNGSGKHNNWSITTDDGINLLDPGKTPHENIQFLLVLACIMKAVDTHADLLRQSASNVGNDHRLGGYEAPPAIISSFLGSQLSELLERVANSTKDELFTLEGKHGVRLDIPQIPELMIDNTDRNRTSPFAFTGNRFEFRAVGSSANCSSALIALNTAVAEALTDFKERVDTLINEKGESQLSAILDILREDIRTIAPLHFDGNGYSDAWREEAARRGLDCETSCPLIFDRYLDEASIKMFERMHVMNRHELAARNEIKWETYFKKVQIEARVLGDLCLNHIIPVATRYQSVLADNVHKIRCAFSSPERVEALTSYNINLIEQINFHTDFIAKAVDEMVEQRKQANRITSIRERAIAYHDLVAPYLEQIRYHCDELELIVEDDMWTLPKYRELLLIR